MAKQTSIGVRCTAEEKEQLEQAAKSERRSLSNYMLNAAFERMSQNDQSPKTIEKAKPETKQQEQSIILDSEKHNF